MNSLRPAAPWICAGCRAKKSTRFNRQSFLSTATEQPPLLEQNAEKVNLRFSSREDGRVNQISNSPRLRQRQEHRSQGSITLNNFLASQAQRESSPLLIQQRTLEVLQSALINKDANLLSSILANAPAEGDEDFLRHVPLATWTQILSLLTSSGLKPPFHRIHRAHSPKELAKIGYAHEHEQYEAVQRLVRLATVRRRQGIEMGLLDYRLLLGCTASIGDGESARRIWVEMTRDGVQPDLACYNSYLSALLWDEKARLHQFRRAIETKERERPLLAPIMTFRARTVTDIHNIYNEMLGKGITGDATTFSLLLVASSRSGRHLDEASGILTHFWGVDMASLARATTPAPPTVELAPTSPLYPTTMVLSAIAEAFGSQNEIPLALRLIDYFSQHFEVPVKDNIWHHLLFWMWMHTRAGTGLTHDSFSRESLREAHQRVVDFFQTKISRTGKKEAPLDELHMISKITFESDKWATDRLLQILEAGRMTYLDSVRKWQGAVVSYKRIKEYAASTQDGARLLRARRHLKRLELERNRQHQYLRRWANSLIQRWASNESTEGVPHERAEEITEWQLRTLPEFVRRWKRFLHSRIKYRIATGDVKLVLAPGIERRHRMEAKLSKFEFRRNQANRLLLLRRGEYRVRNKRRTMRRPTVFFRSFAN